MGQHSLVLAGAELPPPTSALAVPRPAGLSASVPTLAQLSLMLEPSGPGRTLLPSHAAALVQLALAYAASAEQRLAAQAARIAELQNLSITDPLTGLLNRRGFDEALHRCLANASRHGEQGLIAYLDLDGFKSINDGLGHAAGDAALRHVAFLLRSTVRATDYVARMGGDEFAILLTRAAPSSARPIVQKLKDCLNDSAVEINGRAVKLRASVGTATYRRDTTAQALVALADEAMYREKVKRLRRAA